MLNLIKIIAMKGSYLQQMRLQSVPVKKWGSWKLKIAEQQGYFPMK
jgi:hypothetical protein